jgi:predicted dehydrogenase
VAVADEMPARSRALAEKFGVRAYTDPRDMLEREDLNVVDVCTPSGMHGQHAIAVMRSGRHVIVEKPMEITLPAIEEMIRVQEESSVKMAVISQHRFDSASRTVRALLDEGALGRLVLGTAAIPWWRSQEYYDSGAWRGTRELDGGGVLMNQSIHSIDLLQWFMGRVESVRAYTGTLAHRMDTEDVAAVALRFESGALGTISATTGAYPGIITRIEVFGDAGTAAIENDQLAMVRLKRDETEEVGAYGAAGGAPSRVPGAAQNPAAIQTATHAEQIADMIRAIREGGTPAVDGHAARHPVEIILAIYESARTGREVTLSR